MAVRGGNVRVRFDADTSDLSRGTARAERDLDHFSKQGTKSLNALKTAAKAGGIALIGGLAFGAKEAAQASLEAEKSQARLKAQLDALDISYRKHVGTIDRVIQQHSKLSGLDDEDLQDAFTNIVRVTGDVDKSLRLTGLAADFARAKHIDVAKAGELVGKVAGGNTGILSRYGIQIKEGASATEALAALQKKFAGQAEAYGKTTQGSLDRAAVASENLGEVVGAKLTPLLAKGADALVNLLDKSNQLGGPIRKASGAVADAYQDVVRAVRRFADRNREEIDSVIRAGRNLGRAIKFVVEDVMIPVFRRILPVVKGWVEGVLQAFRGLIRIVTGIINGDWKQVWEGFKDIPAGYIRSLKAALKGLWEALRDGLKALVPRALSAAKDIGQAIVKGIAAGIKSLPGEIKGAVGGVLGGAFRGVKGLVGDGIGKVVNNIGIGGAAGALGGTTGLMGADPDLAPIAGLAARFGSRVTSGLRVGATTLSGNQSYHATGDALDLSPVRRAAVAIRNVFGSRLRELITPWPELGIKDGRPFRYSGAIQAQHSGAKAHIHAAFTGPFGDGIGQAAQAAKAAGWSGSNLLTAVAIAGPESSYRNSARLVTSQEDSRGMWQINTLAHPWARGLNLGNPFVAARAAYRVWRDAGGFSPWTAFTSGSYRGFLDRARAAVAGLGGSRGGAGGGGGTSGANTFRPGSGSAGPSGPNTAAGIGDTSADGGSEGLTGPGGGGFEQRVASAERRQARAERRNNLGAFIKALVAERRLKRRRLRKINKALKGRLRKATRLRLTQEAAQLESEIGDLNETIKEYKADQRGGATTITEAEGLEAGVDPDAKDPEAPPTEADFINADLAKAELTPGTEDDIAAAQALVGLRERELAAALATPDPRDDIEAANNLKAARDLLESLTGATDEQNRLIAEQNALIAESNAIQKRLAVLAETQGPQLLAGVIAAVSGSIGGSFGLGGAQAVGVPGQLARY